MVTIVAATASSSHATGPVANLIGTDLYGSDPAHWTTAGTSTGWARFELSVAAALTQYVMCPTSDTPNRNPSAWTFEGSNDGSSWTTMDTRSSQTWVSSPITPKLFSFSNTVSYLYYRLNVSANNGDTYLSFSKMDFNAGPYFSDASEWYPSEQPVNAFDGNNATHWTTNGTMASWLRYDYVSRAKGDYTIYPRSDASSGRNPKTWTWEGSNDASSWTVLDTQTNYTWTLSAPHTFSCSNTTAYRYYRLNVTFNTQGSSYTSLAELSVADSAAAQGALSRPKNQPRFVAVNR